MKNDDPRLLEGHCGCYCHYIPGFTHTEPCCPYHNFSTHVANVQRTIYRVTQNKLRVGVVGYEEDSFDEIQTERMVFNAYRELFRRYGDSAEIAIVSGLQNKGVSAIAYRQACHEWPTIGIGCARAWENDLYPARYIFTFGREWGDELPVFVPVLDVLIRIGGGGWSHPEVEMAESLGCDVIGFDPL